MSGQEGEGQGTRKVLSVEERRRRRQVTEGRKRTVCEAVDASVRAILQRSGHPRGEWRGVTSSCVPIFFLFL
jgi:hypothetical protein